MDSKETHSINYEEAMDMLLKSLEKSEVFQLRRHITKTVLTVGGVLFALDIFLMSNIIGISNTVSALKEDASVTQQLLVQDAQPPVVEEIPEEKIEEPVEIQPNVEDITSISQEYYVHYNDVMDRQECSEEWYIEYKALLDENRDVVGSPDDLTKEFTEAEIKLFQSCVETEVHGGSFQAKVNVANVILNRLYDENKWANDITGVITSPNQFAHSQVSIDESTKLAIEYAYQFPDTTQGAEYFNRGTATSGSNASLDYIFTDDVGHSFFKDKTNYVPTDIITDNLENDDDSVG